MSVIDSLRTKVRTAMNSQYEQPSVRQNAIIRYYKQLEELLKKPKDNFRPVVAAYAAHLDQFMHTVENPRENPTVKWAILSLPIHKGFSYLNAGVQRQNTPIVRSIFREIINQELDIPVITERLMCIAEDKKQHPKIRIEALKAFQSVSLATYASLCPETPHDIYDDRLTVMALEGNTSKVAQFITKREMI